MTRFIVIHKRTILWYGWIFVILLTLMVALSVFTGHFKKVKAVSIPVKQLPIYSVENSKNQIAITFDCAWGADDIPDIVKTLKEADVKATFFIVGTWAEKFPDAVKMLAEAGHDIGNHSYSHFRMNGLSLEKMRDEIAKGEDVLKKISGKEVDLFRPPYGEYNNNVIAMTKEVGEYAIQWDVDSLDWKPGISHEEIMARIHRRVQSGSILLFHNDTPHTAKLLPRVITELKAHEYVFVPVSELILRENYTIDVQGRQRLRE